MSTPSDRRHFLKSTAATLAASRLGLIDAAKARSTEDELNALRSATGWLNSQPLTAASLRGKVVVVDFWTYTCVNWLRTLPYVRAWAEKYKDRGLVVIGVHTPEFPFEHDLENVQRATKQMDVHYPVAIDNDYAVWRGFNNEYWPALYFVDGRGRLRDHHFGEGEYEKSERTIQRLLTEAGAVGFDQQLVAVEPRGVEVAADWNSLRSPENYVGYERTANFAPSGGMVHDAAHAYQIPGRLTLNQWSLAGNWTVAKGAVTLNAPNGRIACRFHARDVNLVMGPAKKGAAVRFHVLLDGQPAGATRGTDVDEHGSGMAAEQRLYQLVRQPQPIAERQFEIEFLDPGMQAFAFTFG